MRQVRAIMHHASVYSFSDFLRGVYIQNGVSERNAALVIAAVDEMVREAKEE